MKQFMNTAMNDSSEGHEAKHGRFMKTNRTPRSAREGRMKSECFGRGTRSKARACGPDSARRAS